MTIKQSTERPSMSEDKVSDVEVHSFVQPSGQYPSARLPARSILVTGASGFLGANLLHDLLAGTAGNIFCLVRGSTEADGLLKVRSALQSQQLWSNVFQGRTGIVIGNLARPMLGMSQTAFDFLANEIDTIYHIAAHVNLLLPYRALHGTNVCGTQELLHLAMTGRPKRFHHVSSVAALGWPLPDEVSSSSERFRLSRPSSFTDGYSESKWAAEQLVNAAFEKGLAASIYRPGLITGHSITGVSNPQDSFSLLIKACTQIGLAPEVPSSIRFTPVDFVSRFILELSEQASSPGRAFHLIGPSSLSWRAIAQILLECGHIKDIVPYADWERHAYVVAKNMPDSFEATIAVLPHILDLGTGNEDSAGPLGKHPATGPSGSSCEQAKKLANLYVTYLSSVA
jgi:thioester reductase-like protein